MPSSNAATIGGPIGTLVRTYFHLKPFLPHRLRWAMRRVAVSPRRTRKSGWSSSVVVSGGITWEGRKLLADVDESVGEVASWITPRLGGVGPTTVAMLLRNTVEAAERSIR